MVLELIVAPRDESSQEPIKFPVRVQTCKLTINDHLKADELSCTVDVHDAGIDPRMISNGVGALYIADADSFGEWVQDNASLRFIGRINKVRRHGGEGKPGAVELHFVDYTSFLTNARPYASKGIPYFNQTIAEAWKQIIVGFENPAWGDNPIKNLEDALEFRGLSAPGPRLSDAAVKRYARTGGQVHVDLKGSAWEVWSQCCGMVGLITFFDRDKVVVTTALDLYTATRTPKFLWGKNILTYNEERNNDFERKGVGITSFDPISGRTIEAVYPPVGDKRIKGIQTTPKVAKKKPAASGHGGGHAKTKQPPGEAELASREHRDYFQFSGITDPDALQVLAKRVWEERSRQEMQIQITTSEMSVDASDGDVVDLLNLHSGDTVQIKIDEADFAGSAILDSLPSEGDRADYFIARGYSEGVARLLARNLEELVNTRREYYIKSVEIQVASSEDGGSFQVDLSCCNKIEISGSTQSTGGASLGGGGSKAPGQKAGGP